MFSGHIFICVDSKDELLRRLAKAVVIYFCLRCSLLYLLRSCFVATLCSRDPRTCRSPRGNPAHVRNFVARLEKRYTSKRTQQLPTKFVHTAKRACLCVLYVRLSCTLGCRKVHCSACPTDSSPNTPNGRASELRASGGW